MKELKTGDNPALAKQLHKQAAKAEALIFEKAARAFLESRRENKFDGRATDDILDWLQKHILPALGNQPLGEIIAIAPEIWNLHFGGFQRNA